jgi:amidase
MPVSRREFLGTAVGAAALAGLGSQALAAPFSGDLVWKTAGQIAQMIRDKQTTSVEVVKACYARIEEVNPKINAVVAICRERALAEAQLADEALAAGRILGPLHGVPFTVKDSFDTEGVVSTGGTLGRKGYVPGRHATVVARVRRPAPSCSARPTRLNLPWAAVPARPTTCCSAKPTIPTTRPTSVPARRAAPAPGTAA